MEERKINILVLTSVYPQPDDENKDVTPTVKYFCQQWNKAGCNVVVIHSNSKFPFFLYKIPGFIQKKVSSKMGHAFPSERSREILEYNDEGIKVFRLPIWKMMPYGKFKKGIIVEQAFRIEKILTDLKFVPDIVLSHWVKPQIELIEELRKRYPVKYSLVFHGDCTKKNIKTYNLKTAVKNLDAVGCRNERYAKYVQSELGLNKLPFVCCSGIPDEDAEKQIIRINEMEFGEKNEFIYVGRLVRYKNIDVIIKALHKVYGKKHYRLHIVGDGAEKNKLMKLARKLGMEERVIFYGFLPRKETFKIMRKSSCFIMVSNNEVFGMVYLEAMLAGCITIASVDGGADGIIINGENGFLSKQGNVDGLVNVLEKIRSMSYDEKVDIRKNAVITAYGYKDSKVAENYLNDIMEWKDRNI